MNPFILFISIVMVLFATWIYFFVNDKEGR